MKKLFTILLITLLLFIAAGCSNNTTPANIHTVNATGTGKITAEPDTVELRLSIISEGKDKSIQQENALKVQKTIDAIIALGLSKEDLETQNLSFNPIYNWDQNKGQQLIGYRAENTLIVKTKDIDKAGAIADTAIKNGAEMVGNLNFTLSDEGKESFLEQAIEKAVVDAKKQVEFAANAANVKITGVQNINIIKESQSPPIYYDLMKAKAAGSEAAIDTPVIPEYTEYTVTVQATFVIE